MTRKHFNAVAAQIRDYTDRDVALAVAREFAQVAQRFNPRFDEQRFLTACGVTQ